MSRKSVPSKRLFVDDDDVHPMPSPTKKVQTGFVEYQPQANGNLAPTVQNARDGSPPQSATAGPASSTSAATRKQISCGECRRLKLKCDRVFPCKACVKRGCADICPDGSLVSGKGSRYVLASTERLHEKISTLVERVRELENALETLHEEHHNCSEYTRNFPPSPHPLLSQEKLFIKSTMDLHAEGTLGRVPLIRKDRQRKAEAKAQAAATTTQTLHLAPANGNGNGNGASPPPLGPPSNSNSSPTLYLPPSSSHSNGRIHVSPEPRERELELNLITDIVISGFFPVLSAAFVPAHERNLQLRRHDELALQSNLYLVLERELPPREEAESLLSLIETSGTFLMIHMLTHRDFTLLLESCYSRLDPQHGMLNFALLFIVCAMGYQIDDSSADEDRDVKMARHCFSLSRVALVKYAFDLVGSGLQDHDDLLRIAKSLYLLGTFLTYFSWKKEDELEASRIIDLLQMAVNRLDLDSDHTHKSYDAPIANERRLMCYAIMSMIGTFSLTSGKMLPGMPRVTSRPPSCANDIDRFPSALEASYHQARDKFLASCIMPMFEMLRSPSTRYEEILELDCTMRDFAFPSEFTQEFGLIQDSSPTPDIPLEARGSVRNEILRFCTIATIHTTLLHLHRPFFQSCLRQRTSVLDGPHVISVFATMRSACIIIRKLDTMEKAYPRFMSKVTISWYHAFCAASALFISIERIPYCPLTPFNVRELNRAVQTFSRSCSPFARHTLPMIRHFAHRGAERLSRWQAVLLEETGLDHSQEKVSYCKQRFQAIRERADAARDAVDRRVPAHTHLGLSRTSSSAAISSIRAQNPIFDQDVYKGLECWDYVHPDVLDIALTLPSCSLEPEDNDVLERSDILSPANQVLDLPPHGHARQSRQPSAGTPSSIAWPTGSGNLAEVFDRLDASLARRTNMETLFTQSRSHSRSPPIPSSPSREKGMINLDQLFKNDVDIDWAALSDILISTPQSFEKLVSINQSTMLNEVWRIP